MLFVYPNKRNLSNQMQKYFKYHLDNSQKHYFKQKNKDITRT